MFILIEILVHFSININMSVFIDVSRKQTGMNPAQFRATACDAET
jgi:hypothetical protein